MANTIKRYIKEGDSAFPWAGESNEGGITLRDYFAGQAVTRLMSADGMVPDIRKMAEYAYRVADAMLKARDITDE